MPRSGNPAFPLANLMLVPFGLFGSFVGAAVLISGEGGELWWLYAAFLVSGALMLGGVASNLVRWWRWQRDENAAAAATEAAVRAHAAPPPMTPVAPIAVPHAALPGPPPAPVVAHWTYDSAEWRAYTRREAAYRGREAFWIFVGVAILGVLLLRWRECADRSTALGVSLGIGALMGEGSGCSRAWRTSRTRRLRGARW
jgi:hypothetical protein